MNKDEALKMAIEAMENSIVYCEDLHHAKKEQHKYTEPCPVEQRWNATIQACKEALAQPAQEPYCWLGYGMQAHDEKPFEGATPLYKHPAPTIKESLMVEPAQEPVAWMDKQTFGLCEADLAGYGEAIPLYTHPAPSWQTNKEFVLLSDDEIIDMYFQASISPQPHQSIINFIRAIEQELKRKNGFKDVKEKNT